MNAHAHVNKSFPDKVFNKGFASLFLNVIAEIAVVAKLHNDVYRAGLVVDEAVVITHYKLAVQLLVLHDLLQSFILVLGCQILRIHNLDDVVFALIQGLWLELGVALLSLMILILHLALEARHVLLSAVHLYALARISLESRGLETLHLINGAESPLSQMVDLLEHRPVHRNWVSLKESTITVEMSY